MKKKTAIVIVLVLLCVLTTALVGCNNSEAYTAEQTAKRDGYDLLNERAEHGQFVMIGDSIVEFWRSEYFYGLDLKTYNRGISGDTSYYLLDRLNGNALSAAPSVVFILVGTNDLGRGKSASSAVDNILKAVEHCKESGVQKVLIGSLLPVNKSLNSELVGKRKNSDIRDINARLSAECDVLQGVEFVDIHSAVVDGDGNFDSDLTYDGLHPNGKCYRKISDILISAI